VIEGGERHAGPGRQDEDREHHRDRLPVAHHRKTGEPRENERRADDGPARSPMRGLTLSANAVIISTARHG